MKAKTTLVILANDAQARLLLNRGIGKGLTELRRLSATQLAGAGAAFADAPGRSRAAPGMARHAIDPRSGEEAQARREFARAVADAAAALWARQRPDRLVIGAEPKVLGALRALLPEPMRAATVVELSKDLLKVPLSDLPRHFEDHILF